MDLTPSQRGVLRDLIGTGRAAPPDLRLADRVREDLERRLATEGIEPGGPVIWLGKHRLNDRDRCEGLFHAVMDGERPPFRHSSGTAAGALFHGAIEVDVITERVLDPRSACEEAARRLIQRDPSFAEYWEGRDLLQRAESAAESARPLDLFRASFPPLARRWAPQPEMRAKAELAGGRVVLSGAPDLVLGRTAKLVIDFKTGRAWPEHPEDMRFYALLFLLRTGVPPYRVATFFLDSGRWQGEDVDETMLERAVSRVVRAAASATLLQEMKPATLTPGAHCLWCPRRGTCPAAPVAGAEATAGV